MYYLKDLPNAVLVMYCSSLAQRITIPQVQEKIGLINTIVAEEFWQVSDVLHLEHEQTKANKGQ